MKTATEIQIHFLTYHHAKKFGCGVEVESVINREEDWGLFNKMRSTTWKEITCRDCLEHLFNVKKKELSALGAKLGREWQ